MFKGIGYFFAGLNLIFRPGLRKFVIAPILINTLLFIGGLFWLVSVIDGWMASIFSWVPDWLSFLQYILWPFIFILLLLGVFYTFGLVANLIAAPFNGYLSEQVEVLLKGRSTAASFSWRHFFWLVPRSVGRELQKLAYYLPRALVLFLLSFVPGLGVITVPLWFLFSAWMFTIQYYDYPMDNHDYRFDEVRQQTARQPITSMSFGIVGSFALMIPIVNFLVMPAAVAGATLFWLEDYRGTE